MMADLKRLVFEEANAFNRTDKTIARYVLDHPQQVLRLSLKDLSLKLFVSESAIFRFCKKIGLSGFTELKFELKEMLTTQSKGEGVNLIQQLETLDQITIKYYRSLKLTNFYQDLYDADKIYLYSTGLTEKILLDYICYQLFLVNKSYLALPAAMNELKMSVSRAKPGSMLMLISYSGNNEASLKELEKIQATSAKFTTVSITYYNDGKISSRTDYNFFYRLVDYAYLTGFPNHRLGWSEAFRLIDLIFGGYSYWLRDKKNQAGENK